MHTGSTQGMPPIDGNNERGAPALPRTVQYRSAGYVEYVDTNSDLSP